MRLACDYLVVGGGAAGCVVAARLSEVSSARVILIEAGEALSNILGTLPVANMVTGGSPRFTWGYRTEAEAALGGRSLPFAQARVLGGGGVINGMIHLRGHPLGYRPWEAAGGPAWGFASLLDDFRRAETNARGSSALHGGDGPMHVGPAKPLYPICERFLDAAESAGLPRVDDLDDVGDRLDAFGHYDLTLHRGRRVNSARAHLHQARHRPNLRVLTGVHARHLLFHGHRVTGAACARGTQSFEIVVEREAILSCGAINSPKLLMLSGIGRADDLRHHGIRARVDLPDVGYHLQNHPAFRLCYAINRPISAFADVAPLAMARNGLAYVLRRVGPFAQPFFPAGGFYRSDPSLDQPDMQLIMGAAIMLPRGPRLRDMLPDRHGFTLAINHGLPKSRGTVALRSADPADSPLIDHRLFSDPADLPAFVKGIERARALVHENPLAGLIEREVGSATVDDSIESRIRSEASIYYHPAGTCRMGRDDRAVVDPQLRVSGIDNLRIADASIMPAIVNANSFAASVAIGERAAALIRAEL